MSPSALQELFPDLPEEDWPTLRRGRQGRGLPACRTASGRSRSSRRRRRSATTATTSSRSPQLGRWLAEKAEEAGAYILTETAGAQLLVEDGACVGVRSGDKGRGKDGEQLGNFEPGSDLIAKATVLAEGSWGHLTGAAIREFDLGAEDPQVWELGRQGGLGGPEAARPRHPHDGLAAALRGEVPRVRRLVDLPDGRGQESRSGFVVGLDYADARFSVHDLLQQFKSHPLVAGSSRAASASAGAPRRSPAGGYWAMPQLSAPGMVICGDAAGMVERADAQGRPLRDARRACSPPRRSTSALKAGGSATTCRTTRRRSRTPRSARTSTSSRNMRQPFAKGFLVGGAIANVMDDHGRALPGRPLGDPRRRHAWTCSSARSATIPSRTASTRSTSCPRRLRHRQRHARRRAEPHPHPGEGAARGRADVAVDVPGAGLRDPRGRARGRPKNGNGSRPRRVNCTHPRTACSAGRSPPRAGA